MIKTMEQESNMRLNINKVAKGSLISIVASIIGIILFSIILTYTKVPESAINTVTIIITAISILLGSELTTRNLKKNGIINGVLVGIVYMIIIYLLSSIITKNFRFNTSAIIMIGAGILAGGIGGIIGVNAK